MKLKHEADDVIRQTVYVRETELSGISADSHLQQTHQSHDSTAQKMNFVAAYAHYTHRDSHRVKMFVSRLRAGFTDTSQIAGLLNSSYF